MGDNLMNGNLFMVCNQPNLYAAIATPEGFHTRFIRHNELGLWMDMQFDSPANAAEYRPMMDEFYRNVYHDSGDLFYRSCIMICDADDMPVGTCFAWFIYGAYWTIHWFKVLKTYEGRGLGRALFSRVLEGIPRDGYPVFLHTHPGSCRAIKLYSDFGFALINDKRVGHRQNQLSEAIAYLKEHMTAEAFRALRFSPAPKNFLDACTAHPYDHF